METTTMTTPKSVYALMSEAQKLFNTKGLAKRMSKLGFPARSIDDVVVLASEIFAEVGLIQTVESTVDSTETVVIDTKNGPKPWYELHVSMTVTYHGQDGTSISSSAGGWFTGNAPAQVSGAAVSYLLKAITLATFVVPVTGQEDPDHPSGEPRPEGAFMSRSSGGKKTLGS